MSILSSEECLHQIRVVPVELANNLCRDPESSYTEMSYPSYMVQVVSHVHHAAP